MTSEGLGEMFEGDFAYTFAGKYQLVSMGAEWRVLRAQTQEQGPPSALAEILKTVKNVKNNVFCIWFEKQLSTKADLNQQWFAAQVLCFRTTYD